MQDDLVPESCYATGFAPGEALSKGVKDLLSLCAVRCVSPFNIRAMLPMQVVSMTPWTGVALWLPLFGLTSFSFGLVFGDLHLLFGLVIGVEPLASNIALMIPTDPASQSSDGAVVTHLVRISAILRSHSVMRQTKSV